VWDRPEWWDWAACRGEHEVFFPRGAPGGGTTSAQARMLAEARMICSGCQTQDECLEWALHASSGGGPAKFGVWAGRTPRQLQDIARDRATRVPA
jgi:hypothetical protein